jgi:hypothetical protein
MDTLFSFQTDSFDVSFLPQYVLSCGPAYFSSFFAHYNQRPANLISGPTLRFKPRVKANKISEKILEMQNNESRKKLLVLLSIQDEESILLLKSIFRILVNVKYKYRLEIGVRFHPMSNKGKIVKETQLHNKETENGIACDYNLEKRSFLQLSQNYHIIISQSPGSALDLMQAATPIILAAFQNLIPLFPVCDKHLSSSLRIAYNPTQLEEHISELLSNNGQNPLFGAQPQWYDNFLQPLNLTKHFAHVFDQKNTVKELK